MPINLENVVARVLAARAVGPAFLAWRAVAQQERLFRDACACVPDMVQRRFDVFRMYRRLAFELLSYCFAALAGKPQPRFTVQV